MLQLDLRRCRQSRIDSCSVVVVVAEYQSRPHYAPTLGHAFALVFLVAPQLTDPRLIFGQLPLLRVESRFGFKFLLVLVTVKVMESHSHQVQRQRDRRADHRLHRLSVSSSAGLGPLVLAFDYSIIIDFSASETRPCRLDQASQALNP